MKQIIEGKLYDTKIAEQAGYIESSVGRSDFEFYEEGLYLTENGSWFLAGEGHARTEYAKRFDDGAWGMGEGIIPLARGEAREWLERNVSAEEYAKYFKPKEG